MFAGLPGPSHGKCPWKYIGGTTTGYGQGKESLFGAFWQSRPYCRFFQWLAKSLFKMSDLLCSECTKEEALFTDVKVFKFSDWSTFSDESKI
jgi:hypothetical protein